MTKSIKFIHTADIHLGKELSYNNISSYQLPKIFNRATKKAFENLIELALKEAVDFIIIAGDLYDREARSIQSSRFFQKQCQYLNDRGIELYLISGNHDPSGEEREVFELPQNVNYFSSEEIEIMEYKKNGKLAARILGQSYRNKFEARTMYNYYTAPDQAVFNIGLLHTALNKDSRHYVPVNKSDLLSKKDIHYWALGHLHQYQKINSEPAVYFPGTIQGHNISETGNKGAILVEVDSNLNFREKFVQLAPIIFNQLEINLEKEKELDNISQLQRLLTKKINDFLEEIRLENEKRDHITQAVISRIIIRGRTKLHQYVDNNREELEETLLNDIRTKFGNESPNFWLHSIFLKTAKKLNSLNEIKDKNPIFQNLENLVEEILEDEKLAQELLAEWGEVWEGSPEAEDRSNYKFYADSKLKREIVKEAEKIIISELLEDRN